MSTIQYQCLNAKPGYSVQFKLEQKYRPNYGTKYTFLESDINNWITECMLIRNATERLFYW